VRSRSIAAALAGVALLAAGCASIPTSSPPQVFPLNSQSTAPDSDIRYDVIQPRAGESPSDIVKDFIALGGSHRDQHAGARAYLTPDAAKTWNDGASVIVLEDNLFFDDRGPADGVLMTARQRGRIEKDGTYLPNPASYPYSFHLEQVGGEWRIKDPPDGVFVTDVTFERSWRPYSVYFLDSTRTRVVPDVRMVPYPQDNTLPSRLVSYLGDGPSSRLEGAVASDLDGARLQTNIVRDEKGSVRVYLVGLNGGDDGTLDPGGFAQLVWTLNPLGVGSIQVFVNGRPVAPPTQPQQTQQRIGDWRRFDPNALPVTTAGYFIRDGAVLTTTGDPVPGPVGNRSFGARSVGVSLPQPADQSGRTRQSIAVVRRVAGGVGLYIGRLGGMPELALTAKTLTTPTWGSAVDEVWTVKDGREVVSVQTNGQSTSVLAPDLEDRGPVSSLRLSRDGARVAVVVGPPNRQRLWLGVVVRTNGAARIANLFPVNVGDQPVTDVSWSDALTLIVLVRPSAEEGNLYTFTVDARSPGRIVNAANLPGPPTVVAAAPNLPLLAIASRTAVRSVEAGEPWKRVTPQELGVDSAPAYPG
jgi:hypothetical protein